MRIPISQQIGIGLVLLLIMQVILFLVIVFDVGEYRHNALVLNTYVVPSGNLLNSIESQLLENLADCFQYSVNGVTSHRQECTEGMLVVQERQNALAALQQYAPQGADKHQAAAANLQGVIQLIDRQLNIVIQRRDVGETIDPVAFSVEIDQYEDQLREAIAPLAAMLDADNQLALQETQADPLIVPGTISVITFLLASGMLFFLIRPIVQRLRRLQHAALQISAGSQAKQLMVEGNDEITDLTIALNSMLQQIDRQQHILHERAEVLSQANQTQEHLLATVQSLAVPAIPVGPQTLALPLMGVLDAKRIEQITQKLLDTVHRSRARMVLIDVTGLVLADQTVAHFLIDTTTSLKLLGSHTAITGMSANLAQTLVELNAGTQQLQVFATLHEGIAASTR
jgi:anti-anti-sigma regulatory factor/HAMP domain-containing protein